MHLDSKHARIFVAGHRGLLGSAITRRLQREGFDRLLLRSRHALDLRDQRALNHFFEDAKPEFVVLAAARVGGILANDTFPADFIGDNLRIQTNVLHAAYKAGVKRLLFMGSTCIYPKEAPQPLKEEYLLTGPLEPTNEWYAVAKIAGVKYCQALRRQHGCDFVSLMATNLYGPGDNFDLQTSHVLPALLYKVHSAKSRGADSFTVWGTGTPRREFLFCEDLADACLHILKQPEHLLYQAAPDGLLNVGVGKDITINELVSIIQQVVGSSCSVQYDLSMPDGTPRKLVDVSRISSLGWHAPTALRDGIQQTYTWMLQNQIV